MTLAVETNEGEEACSSSRQTELLGSRVSRVRRACPAARGPGRATRSARSEGDTGSAGPQGPAGGVSGYEIVGSDGRSVAPFGISPGFARCPAGEPAPDRYRPHPPGQIPGRTPRSGVSQVLSHERARSAPAWPWPQTEPPALSQSGLAFAGLAPLRLPVRLGGGRCQCVRAAGVECATVITCDYTFSSRTS